MKMSSTTTTQSPRCPMRSLNPHENVPFPFPKKSIQLGIEAFTKKRDHAKLDVDSSSNPNPPVKKIKATTGESVSSNGPEKEPVICHQCRQHVHPAMSIQCTALKNKGSGMKRCSIWYCHRCLSNRYSEKLNDILAKCDKEEGHISNQGYTWSCPSCRGDCNCSYCRKKKGLAPLGYTYYLKKDH